MFDSMIEELHLPLLRTITFTTIWRLLPIKRICAAEIRLSFDCKHFAFFFFCIYIEKDIALISAGKYAWSAKAA